MYNYYLSAIRTGICRRTRAGTLKAAKQEAVAYSECTSDACVLLREDLSSVGQTELHDSWHFVDLAALEPIGKG